ncbi:regulator of G-protein signaling 9-binding protein [Pristis pectinata]|uniref:regulator of G-protein signaling 9-binding protein n=1 Tax=Pristis pectinata TaxID=685728 RepID=UPI00223E3BCB|nr:regulator of G-protein signaling 9-binding protein [Pristis pectinata]
MSAPRAALCPAQILRCLRSYLRAQLAEPGWAAGLLGECGRAVGALEALSAEHRDLARGVGGSADSAALRQRLRRTAARTPHQCKDQPITTLSVPPPAATGIWLLLLLSRRQSLEPQEQEQLECWWLRFAFCMELFRRDLSLVRRLSLLFPLDLPRTSLTNTGVTCDPTEASTERSAGPEGGEETESAEPSLEEQIAEIGIMLREVETKVQAPDWSAQATAEAWAEASFGDAGSTDSPDLLTEEEARQGSGRNAGDCCTIV